MATGSEARTQTSPGPRRIPTFASFSFAADTVPVGVTPTQWKKGAAIGSIALGVPVFVLALGLCGDTDSGGTLGNGPGCVVGSTVVGALTGAVIGGLIGGLFPRTPRPTAPDDGNASTQLNVQAGPEYRAQPVVALNTSPDN